VWMHTQNNITNTNLQYSSNLCHCYNCFLDHLCPMMVHFSQSAMLHCRVIPTKHTEFIGCISQLHPVCPCKFISDAHCPNLHKQYLDLEVELFEKVAMAEYRNPTK
jgi:hypothetical protein